MLLRNLRHKEPSDQTMTSAILRGTGPQLRRPFVPPGSNLVLTKVFWIVRLPPPLKIFLPHHGMSSSCDAEGEDRRRIVWSKTSFLLELFNKSKWRNGTKTLLLPTFFSILVEFMKYKIIIYEIVPFVSKKTRGNFSTKVIFVILLSNSALEISFFCLMKMCWIGTRGCKLLG